MRSLLLFATADGEGRYRIEDLNAGALTLEASHPEFSPVTRQLELRSGHQVLDFQLLPLTTDEIAGRVLTLAGDPVANLEVQLLPLGGGVLRRETSAADGSFAFRKVPAGEYRWRIGDRYRLVEPQGELQVRGQGVLLQQDVLVRPGLNVFGRLVGLPEDETCERVSIVASTQGAVALGQVAPADGTYTLTNLAPGVWRIVAETTSTGFRASATVELAEGDAQTQVDLDFARGFVLRGQVLRHGQPLTACQVLLRAENPSSMPSGSPVFPDLQGRFALRGLSAGTQVLEVSLPAMLGQPPRLVHRQALTLDADQELVVEVETGTITGRVQAQNSGDPIAGAVVVLGSADAPRSQTAMTDPEGVFVLDPVPLGRFQLEVEKTGYAPSEAVVNVAGEGTLTQDFVLVQQP